MKPINNQTKLRKYTSRQNEHKKNQDVLDYLEKSLSSFLAFPHKSSITFAKRGSPLSLPLIACLEDYTQISKLDWIEKRNDNFNYKNMILKHLA